MAETLGSLCDKLTIVKLKQFHSQDNAKIESLNNHEKQLIGEINEFVENAVVGKIPVAKLTFDSNKVYKKEGNFVKDVHGSIAQIIDQLAEVNCKLWHEQEKVYDFEVLDIEQKDLVVKQLAVLNLERNKCIDKIDHKFKSYIENPKNY